MAVAYGEVEDIEGLEKDVGRAGTDGGSDEDVGTVGDASTVADAVDGADEVGTCEPALSHGFGGDAIKVATKVSWKIHMGYA